MKPSASKPRSMQPIRFDMPCGMCSLSHRARPKINTWKVTFMRLDKSIDPVQLVHRLCTEAQANPTTKTSRWIQRMTPVTEIRKTLRVDLEAFAKEILAPHFHSGGPPKKVSRVVRSLALIRQHARSCASGCRHQNIVLICISPLNSTPSGQRSGATRSSAAMWSSRPLPMWLGKSIRSI